MLRRAPRVRGKSSLHDSRDRDLSFTARIVIAIIIKRSRICYTVQTASGTSVIIVIRLMISFGLHLVGPYRVDSSRAFNMRLAKDDVTGCIITVK